MTERLSDESFEHGRPPGGRGIWDEQAEASEVPRAAGAAGSPPVSGMDAAGRARMVGYLQRLYGNAAVQRLVADDKGAAAVQRDSVSHASHPTLSWKDFKGKPDKKSPFDAETASERSGLAWKAKVTKSGGVWAAEATVNPSSLDLKASMNRGLSWVRKGKQSADLLRHEQGHFDIENVLVEKGEIAIKSVATGAVGTGTGSTAKKAAAAAYADLQTTAPFQKLASLDSVLHTAQDDYDVHPVTGTNHGTKAAQQAQWEADIIANLPAFPIP